MSETTRLFPCLHGCGTLLPQRRVCADCVNVYYNNLVEAAARGNRCDQCGREHLPHTECVSWAEHCSMRDTLTAQVEAERQIAHDMTRENVRLTDDLVTARLDLAAACAEVERLTARLEIDLGGSDKIDELTYALEYVRTEVGQARRTSTYWKDELAAANRECEALSVRASKAEADLAAVRKVEEWHGGLTGRHIVQCADGRFVAAHYPAQQTAGAERIAAGPLDFVSLGRALAAQETDNAK